MIISAPADYRRAAQQRLPHFLFDYIDGGANIEATLQRNCDDLARVELRQRVLRNMSELSLEIELFGRPWSLPVALGPVGATGTYARRGEVQAARAAAKHGVPYTLSTVSICSVAEVSKSVQPPIWFQLYVLKDRGFMRDALERAKAAGVRTLVFTVDMPVPGSRYRDRHSGMSGPASALRQVLQAMTHPIWAFDVGLFGQPLTLGNISAYLGRATNMTDYMGWISANFDPSICWKDLEWVREFWTGDMIVKGVLDVEDARDAVRFGADGVIVSNHGGRQLDGVPSTARALPAIADAVGDDLTVLADSGVRSGLDVVRMIALGARAVLLGRSYIYALAANGEQGVANLLSLYAQEMRVAMTLTGARSITEITRENLTQGLRDAGLDPAG
ncbi:MAG: FMN-dependent L-lactate dehydrogenase LldD [Pseudomonadota bacterium]|jgi:L-lactate dehydrogenase (cytochrome)